MLASRSVRMGSCLSGLSKVCAAPAAGAARRHAHTVEEASFELPPFKLHHLEPAQGPPTHTVLTRADALQHYRDMVVIRRLETVAANMYKEKAIRGFCHLSSGQEAVAAGMKAALRPNDSVITSYRCHGIVHMLGVPVVNVLAELAGHKSGCSRGKGGSMHMYGPNFYGGNGIVGAQVPLGAGIGLAHKYKGDGGVCYAMYGDGAANQGQVFEAFNMAQLWHLPVVFLCENNHYGMGTAQDRASASVTFYTRGDYIPGVQIDGMDVLAVKEACKFAAEYCSSDKGPLVFEMVTYRYHGHSMSDPGTSYRTRDEVQDMRQKKDPITGYREKIVAAGLADLDELKEIEMEVKKQTDADVKKAKADTEIDAVELSYDVYENNLHGLLRGRTVFETLEHKNTRRGINAA